MTDDLNLTADEQAQADRMLTDLNRSGYRTVDQHGRIRPGARIRHRGHQWPEALRNGSGVVLAITEKRPSGWSDSWGMPDVELIAVWDKPSLDSRLSQLAQYHVEAVAETASP
jgi:hypothetical protein